MGNWKSNVDRLLKAREEAEERRRAEASRQAAGDRAARLQEHRREFFCHVCGKPSNGPGVDSYRYYDMIYESEDWTTPTGLVKCKGCHQWTCHDHYYKGFCKDCADRL